MMTTDAPRPRRRFLGNAWVNVALALALAVIAVAFLGQPSSGSMSPTLEPGDRIIVNRLAYIAADPAPGDIVVFRPDEGWGERPDTRGNWFSQAFHWLGETTGIRPYVLVKRVVAGPGETVECCDASGSLTVDGETLSEPYVEKNLPFAAGTLDCGTQPMSTRCFGPVTVPADSYLVLGDNRTNSADSVSGCRGMASPDEQCWRWMTRDDVFGQAGPILWPIGRWGGP